MANLTKKDYLRELVDIKEKLEDFMNLINKGRLTYYKEIALKLRILYCSKSGKPPLFTTICDIFDFDIKVFIRYSAREKVDKGLWPASLADGLVFEQINSVVSWFERGDEFIPLLEAINRNEVLINNEYHSYKHILEVVGDKMAGHIDSKIDDRDLILHSSVFLIGGLPIAQRAIFDTAKSTVILINIIIDFLRNGKSYPFIIKR